MIEPRKRNRCKEAVRKYNSEYYKRNKESILNKQRATYAKSPSSKKLYALKRYYDDPAKSIAKSTSWQKSHPERMRKFYRDYYRKNIAAKRAAMKKWRAKNFDKMTQVQHARRARKCDSTSEDCREKIRELKLVENCYWCDVKLEKANRSIDHVMPLSRGGCHVPENLVACCLFCNTSKHNKLVHEWDGFIRS